MEINKDFASFTRLLAMGDWLKLKRFNSKKLYEELQEFANEWKTYNSLKPDNKRYGLSVTSLDGGLSGVPDLESLLEYNNKNGTSYTNADINKKTEVYEKCPTLQKILKPFEPWLTRCHFIKLDSGGFFPEHYDIEKIDLATNEIRLIGFVNRNHISQFKFCYEDNLVQNIVDGDLYYFNANKHHSVFSMTDDSIQLVIMLKYDYELYKVLVENYVYK